MELNGKCLCGAVGVSAPSASDKLEACHCSMCQNWGGGPLLALDCKSDVIFSGEDKIRTFSSSAWAERGFCAECGTHLFYRLKESGQYIIPAGLFGLKEGLTFETQIFIDHKPAFYDFANKTRMMTGEEVFAAFTQNK